MVTTLATVAAKSRQGAKRASVEVRTDIGTATACSAATTAPVADLEALGPKPSLPVLSPRESQVLDLVADGLSNAQIAKELGVSPFTVKTTLANAAGRLGTGSRAGMVGVAYRWGLFERSPMPAGLKLPQVSTAVWAVLPLVARGLEDPAIGKELGVSMNAANCRVKRLMSEFGVSSRAHLVRLAIDTGVLTPVLGLSDRAMDSRLTGGVLPEREAQVLALMAQGVSDVAVARVLGVTERTVARLVRQAMTRLRAASRPHAVFVACGLGILRPPSRVGASS